MDLPGSGRSVSVQWIALALPSAGRSQRQERVKPTWDIIKTILMRRLKWLGHILRLDNDRMLKQAVLSMKKPYPKGSIMMNAPPHDSIQELIDLAGDHGWENHKEWTSLVKEFGKNFVEFPNEEIRLRTLRTRAPPRTLIQTGDELLQSGAK